MADVNEEESPPRLLPTVPEYPYTLNQPEGLLAHYTSAEVAFEHVLPPRRLRMSPYRFMRDPIENKDIVPGTGAYGETPDNFDEAYQSALDGIKFLRDECRILSLTHDVEAERTFGCSWARPRMWEQYADNHRGVCLVFDGPLLEYNLATAFKEHELLAWLEEVRYTPAGIAGSKINFFADQRIFEDAQQRADAVAEFIEDNSDDFFFLKSDDFETEHEFRAVLMPTDGFESEEDSVSVDGDYAFVDYGDALVAVIVGERFPNWQLLGANRACERVDAMFGKIGWRNGRPIAFPPVLDD
jgi:hypothetical protein